ncbi:hypothetical protein WQQ_15360 [Hydrocarboniphaga effusa AP103]|uniref:Uncharacterized protein n=1 Tax=Hydrocarboniphaga effusa AP103 TaxID=1172194 RepID=I7ZHM2_9GAMM|nr:hypothetical protein WQQ_15360 [Hydrocarboniphaga effusa AP103]
MKPQITIVGMGLAIYSELLQRSCGMKPQITFGYTQKLVHHLTASKELRHEAADHKKSKIFFRRLTTGFKGAAA